MKLEDLKSGMHVRITSGHPHVGRIGYIVEVGSFDLLVSGKRTGAVVDIGEAGLLVVSPQYLERVEPDPLPLDWEEFDV